MTSVPFTIAGMGAAWATPPFGGPQATGAEAARVAHSGAGAGDTAGRVVITSS